MRIAIISDIHANLTALEAVVSDVRDKSPDLVLCGGDLADGGARPAEVIDRLCDLGWKGIIGNTDEMLIKPASLNAYAEKFPALQAMFSVIGEMASWTRDRLGQSRLDWISRLDTTISTEDVTLLHASPGDLWKAPLPGATAEELQSCYEPAPGEVIVYGHIHLPFIRKVGSRFVVNSGSVGLPFDGDKRASYVLIDGAVPTIQRVDYDLDEELRVLSESKLPHANWTARILTKALPEMP
jgi:putative phosphoesterase